MLKKLKVHMKKSMKVLILLSVAILAIIGILFMVYKPTYSVYLNGEQIGYTNNKRNLQNQINEYIEKGNGDNSNLAYIQIEELPEYEVCLLKKNIVSNDEEILASVKAQGVEYYRYYAILESEEEKFYVATFAEAEKVVADLTEKESDNIEKISIVEKYQTEIKELTTSDVIVADLYVEKPKPVYVATTTTTTSRSSGTVPVSTGASSAYVDLGITLTQPTYGTITAGWYGYPGHTAIDIANSRNTPIYAAAGGTVSFSGWKGSYGNFIVIDHGNGVQTYYAHCNSLSVSYGQTVSKGQQIALMGSTGNSSGNHLHFEVRVNGKAYNPSNYL